MKTVWKQSGKWFAFQYAILWNYGSATDLVEMKQFPKSKSLKWWSVILKPCPVPLAVHVQPFWKHALQQLIANSLNWKFPSLLILGMMNRSKKLIEMYCIRIKYLLKSKVPIWLKSWSFGFIPNQHVSKRLFAFFCVSDQQKIIQFKIWRSFFGTVRMINK